MGKIWMSPNRLASFFEQRVGFKSGLALTRSELRDLIGKSDGISTLVTEYSDEPVRVLSTDITEGFQKILYGLGVTERPWIGDPPTLLNLKYENRGVGAARKFNSVLRLLGDMHFTAGVYGLDTSFDQDRYFAEIAKLDDDESMSMARELVSAIREYEQALPWDWYSARVEEWENTLPLKKLFESEQLDATYGNYFDARYIGFLARNLGSLDVVHWRKFEALTAEYYSQAGFHVELGPGRSDGGVDLRMWRKSDDSGDPPLVIVQCKRQQRLVEKVVVKSLWADLVDENAKFGLVVTTSGLSRGSKATISKRRYPITVSERKHVEGWVKELHRPARGVFLGT